MYTEVLDNPTGNFHLAASREHSFLLSHRDAVLHTSVDSRKSNHIYDKNPTSSTATHIQSPSLNPNDPLLPTYCARKRDTQEEYLSIIKTALRNTIQIINFAELTQITREREALMQEVNTEARHISSKYRVQIDPLHFKWNTFIPILEENFPDILGEILKHDDHRYASVQFQG